MLKHKVVNWTWLKCIYLKNASCLKLILFKGVQLSQLGKLPCYILPKFGNTSN